MTQEIQRHGLSVGIERTDTSEFFLTLKAVGRLTHEDYKVITPMIDSALAGVESPRIKVYIDGTQMLGWEPRAAWDDFKLGAKHARQFDKIAICGNKHWQELMAKVSAWFLSGEAKYFESKIDALAWLSESDPA